MDAVPPAGLCPRCRVPLAPAAPDVDGCSACGGVFLHTDLSASVALLMEAPGIVDDVAAVAAAAARIASDRRGDVPCPSCQLRMQKHRFGLALLVDSCEHGTWFDAGELPRLRDALARGVTAVLVAPVERAPPSR